MKTKHINVGLIPEYFDRLSVISENCGLPKNRIVHLLIAELEEKSAKRPLHILELNIKHKTNNK